MEIRLFFLTAFIASSGLPPVQPRIETGVKAIANEVNADGEVQQNLRSLFDSLSKNDLKKTNSFRDILEREAAEEQTAFDAMKDDLRRARKKNAYPQRNSYKNGDNGEKAAVFKRETSEAPVGGDPGAAAQEPTAGAAEPTPNVVPPEPEPVDEFLDYKPNILYNWKEVVKAYEGKDIKFLRFFCTAVHALAGWGWVNVTKDFLLDQAVIVYQNPAYHRTDIQFLQYIVQPPQFFEDSPMMDRFYLTEGVEEDCVVYLIPTDRHKLNAFRVNDQVCGIGGVLNGTATPVASEMSACAAEPSEG